MANDQHAITFENGSTATKRRVRNSINPRRVVRNHSRDSETWRSVGSPKAHVADEVPPRGDSYARQREGVSVFALIRLLTCFLLHKVIVSSERREGIE